VPSVVKQTLYPASGRAAELNVLSGTARAWTTQTEAEAHDGNDATYDKAGIVGDGMDLGIATLGVKWTLDSCTYAGTIDKVRVGIRSKYAKGALVGTQTVQCMTPGGVAGTEQALASTAGWHYFDFATNPYGGAAWTAAAINAGKWGWLAALETATEYSADWLDAYGFEYALEVYGPDVQTSTPASVGLVGAVCAASILIGAVGSSCDSVNMTAAVNSTTGVPGSRTVLGDSVGMVAEVSPSPLEAFALSGLRAPQTVTPLASRQAGGSVLATLRCRDASLRDGRWDTYEGDSQIGPFTGELTIGTLGVGLDSIEGSGAIAGVVVHCIARLQSEPPLPAVSNARITFNGHDHALTTTPPSGDYGAGQVNYADCATALITTSDGGTSPWTWENLYTALLMLSARVHVVYGGIGTPTEFDVCELWVEVRGPVGSQPSILRGRDWMRRLRGTDVLESDLGGS
jgi:hypothetical protein